MAKSRKYPSIVVMGRDPFETSRYMPKAYRQQREADRSLTNLIGRKAPKGTPTK
jgi:hypothetical protein